MPARAFPRVADPGRGDGVAPLPKKNDVGVVASGSRGLSGNSGPLALTPSSSWFSITTSAPAADDTLARRILAWVRISAGLNGYVIEGDG